MALDVLQFRIKGLTPLCVHRGGLANPMDPWSKAMKVLTGKKKKTDEDIADLARTEFLGSMYVDPFMMPGEEKNKFRIVVPGLGVESAIKSTAKRQRLGKTVQAAVMSDGDWTIEFDGQGKSPQALWDGGKHFQQFIHRVGPARVVRTVPMFRSWEIEFTLQFMADEINRSTLEQIVADCGRLKRDI